MKFIFTLVCTFLFIISTVSTYPTNVEDQVQNPEFVRAQRQAGRGGDHHDVVDFGAHTGDHGAFGWYADFPVHAH